MAFQKRSLEAKHMGEEPDPRDWMELEEDALTNKMHEAFRWYYKFYDFKETMDFVSEYYKKNKVKTTSPKKIKPIDLESVGMHVGYIARLKTRGIDHLPEHLETLFIDKLKKIEEIANVRKVVNDSKPDKIKPDIQKRIREAARRLRYDIEEVIDEQIDDEFKKKFNFKQFLERNKVTRPVAKHLKVEISELASEIILAKKGDPDFKEAYSHLSGHQQNRLIKFYEKMTEECETIITTKKSKKKIVKKVVRLKRKK